jgi:hypothetical protein
LGKIFGTEEEDDGKDHMRSFPWPDTYVEPIGEPDANDVLGLIALIMNDLALVSGMLLCVYSGLFAKNWKLPWYNWLFLGMLFAGFGISAWGWVVKI